MRFNIIHIFRGLLLVPLALAVSVACSKYDSPANEHHNDYGTAYEYESGNVAADFYIVRDDGVKLYIKSNLANDFKARDEQRVKCNYEVLSTNLDTRSAQLEECEIKLYLISDVLEKTPVSQGFIDEDTEKRTDSIGADPFYKIEKMFYSGKYVNIEFTYYMQPKLDPAGIHHVNLVYGEADAAGIVKARICHNAYGDVPSGSEGSFIISGSEVSFDLSSLIPEGRDSVTIEFEWLEYGREKPRTARKLFTRSPMGNTLIVGSFDNDGTLYHYFDNVR